MKTAEEVITWIRSSVEDHGVVEFSPEIWSELEIEQCVVIASELGKKYFLRLPKAEQIFFEWLKENDRATWNDLWVNDLETDAENKLAEYTVSLSFLPVIKANGYRGFPICDLVNVDNYFLSSVMFTRNINDLLEPAKARFVARNSLTVPQLLAVEISVDPIDIWHFAFHHDIEIERAKKAVKTLVEDNLIDHPQTPEQILFFFPEGM